jgi:hypothetical protein
MADITDTPHYTTRPVVRSTYTYYRKSSIKIRYHNADDTPRRQTKPRRRNWTPGNEQSHTSPKGQFHACELKTAATTIPATVTTRVPLLANYVTAAKQDGSAMSLGGYNVAERSSLTQQRNVNPDDDDDPRATTTN